MREALLGGTQRRTRCTQGGIVLPSGLPGVQQGHRPLHIDRAVGRRQRDRHAQRHAVQPELRGGFLDGLAVDAREAFVERINARVQAFADRAQGGLGGRGGARSGRGLGVSHHRRGAERKGDRRQCGDPGSA